MLAYTYAHSSNRNYSDYQFDFNFRRILVDMHPLTFGFLIGPGFRSTRDSLDNRGEFREILVEKNIKIKFPFNVISKSKKNVIRGLHYQLNKPQGKFISVIKGEILDVALDLRKNSKTFCKHFKVSSITSSVSGLGIKTYLLVTNLYFQKYL